VTFASPTATPTRSLRPGPARGWLMTAALAFALGSAATAGAQEPESRADAEDTFSKTLDFVVLRPLGLVEVLAGSGFFVVSSPVVVPTGRTEAAWDLFVEQSVDATFRRPIGDL